MRREILEMLFDTDSIRPAAVRRSFLEDYLYATDLPLTASEETIDNFRRKAEKNGWRTMQSNGWIQMDRIPETVPSGVFPDYTGPEALCCLSILRRHTGKRRNGDREKRMLLKAADESPEAYEKICRVLHREWAAAMRDNANMPDIPDEYFTGGKKQCLSGTSVMQSF